MTIRRLTLLSVTILLAALVSSVDTGAQEEAPRYTAVTKVTRDTRLESTGRLLTRARDAIDIQAKAYRGRWALAMVMEDGSRVKKGDVVARFETEEIERTLQSALFDLENALTGHRHRERHAELSREAVKDEIIRTERSLVEARLRLEGWTEHQLAMAREDARLNKMNWEMSVGNLKEELAELEKMYEEDELVEATEELVLNRTRRSLEHRIGTYEQVLRKRKFTVEFEENRRAEALRVDLELRERSYARRRIALEMEEESRRLSLEGSRRGLDAKRRHLADLEKDRQAMTVRAPRDGILLYGADVTDGKRLELGRSMRVGSAFLTVVDPGELTVRFQVPAKKLLSVEVGQIFSATPVVDGAKELRGRVETVSLFATGDQKLTLLGKIRLPAPTPGAIGGINCKVSLKTGTEDVLTVPEDAIHKDDEKVWCLVKQPDGQALPMEVKVGEKLEGGRVVIEGLDEGAQVLLGGGK